MNHLRIADPRSLVPIAFLAIALLTTLLAASEVRDAAGDAERHRRCPVSVPFRRLMAF
jgi:hypothetical protein